MAISLNQSAPGHRGVPNIPSPPPVPPARPPRPAPPPAVPPTLQYADELIPPALQALAVPMHTVSLDPHNPRVNDKAAKRLAQLIRIHRFRKPILVDRDGIIRAGNTAYKAAKILGMTSIPVIRHEDLSDAEAREYGVSDNVASEWSDWDHVLLHELRIAEQIRSQEATGMSDKQWKTLELSGDTPDALPQVSISGDSAEQGEFVVVRFNKADNMERFKQVFGMGKFDRALYIGNLIDGLRQTGSGAALVALGEADK